MNSYIPFIRTKSDLEYLKRYFSKVKTVRVQYFKTSLITALKKENYRIWIDSSFDIFEKWPLSDDNFKQFSIKYKKLQELLASGSLKRKIKEKLYIELEKYISQVVKNNYSLLSLPQLPYPPKLKNISLNRELLKSTIEILDNTKKNNQLILPIVISHQDILNKKPQRDKLIDYIIECNKKYSLYGVWVVDKSLVDYSGSDTLKKRFNNLIIFHESLKDKLPDEIKIMGGPYWALNLILWGRELIDNPIIGLGNGFQYFTSGQRILSAKEKIVIPPLYRLSQVNPELKQWLVDVISKTDKNNSSIKELNRILQQFDSYSTKKIARNQIVKFYSKWLEELHTLPSSSRSIALYQYFSSAFVFGKKISIPLPKSESPARAPEKVAQQYMLNCL